MKAKSLHLLAVAIALVGCPIGIVYGQSAENALTDRLEQLESETQTLRAELQSLRQRQEEPVRLPQVASTEMALAPALPAAPLPSDGSSGQAQPVLMADASVAPAAPALTMDAVRGEMKKLAWSKGDFKITPYGSLWCDMLYETERTNTGPYTLWVPSREVEGEDAFYIDARRTRLGIDVDGPRIPFFCCAKSSGRVEIDFHGEFVNENKGSVLLRHAYWQVKDDYFAFLVGQTWDVISPLYPGALNYSVGWNGGNIGFRRAQFRAERYLHFSPEFLLILQSSLNQNVTTDFAGSTTIDREPTNWPLFEGRVAAKLGPRGQGCLPIEIGASGHVGETGHDFLTTSPAPASLAPEDDFRALTWSFNTDIQVPITERLKFQGEFFTGQNLSTFLGGIGQGVDLGYRDAIHSTGGWFDIRYDWSPRLRSFAGFGIDDPNNNDILYGRVYNQFVFVNMVFDITKKFLTGVEVSYWKTHYQDLTTAQLQPTEPGESVVTQWMVQYSF